MITQDMLEAFERLVPRNEDGLFFMPMAPDEPCFVAPSDDEDRPPLGHVLSMEIVEGKPTGRSAIVTLRAFYDCIAVAKGGCGLMHMADFESLVRAVVNGDLQPTYPN